MATARLILAIGILLLAGCIVVMNWICVFVSLRNKRRGIDRHHSMVPLISIVLTGVASLAYPHSNKFWMIVIPLLDPATWSLLWLPIFLVRESIKKRATEQVTPRNQQ